MLSVCAQQSQQQQQQQSMERVWLRLTAVERVVAIGRLKTLEAPVKLVYASGPGAYAHPNKSGAEEIRAHVSASS